MKLDSRIIDGKKPLDCFDAENSELMKSFLNKEGYVSNNIASYCFLNKCPKRFLSNVFKEVRNCFTTCVNGGNGGDWKYFLPAEWVKEPEKYRPYRLREFLHKFKFGDAIYIQPKNSKTNEERMVIFSEYRTELYKDESNNAESVCLTGIEHHLKSVVCLGIREYDLTTLFDKYEYFDADGKEWKPFGVKE